MTDVQDHLQTTRRYLDIKETGFDVAMLERVQCLCSCLGTDRPAGIYSVQLAYNS